jgi:WD40 repeat protein
VEGDLLAALVGDVNEQPGALPMLQYALTETFDHSGGGPLTLDAYHAIGGLSGALARRADEVLARLDAPSQAQARQFFLRLVTLGEGVEDTRRRILRSELESLGVPAPSQQVLEVFGHARLLFFDRDPVTRSPTVEVAHEALLREWPRLRDWLSASRADVRLQRQLAAAAFDWNNARCDLSFLLSGARLAQFEGWAAETQIALTRDERAFLDASLAERQAQQDAEAARQARELEAAQKLAETEKRRAEEQTRSAARLRQRAFYLVLALGAALVLLVATLGLAQLSNQNLAAARTANTQAVAEIQNRSTAEANALAEAYSRATAEVQAQTQKNAALNAQATAQVEAQERATAEANAVQARTTAEKQAGLAFARELDAAAELKVATDPQLSLLLALQAISVTRAAGLGDPLDAQQTLHDVVPAQRLLRVQSVEPNQTWTVAYSPDGRYLAVDVNEPSYDLNSKIWVSLRDAASGEELRQWPGQTSAFTPDGKWLATLDRYGNAHLFDVLTGELALSVTGHTLDLGLAGNIVPNEAISPDGRWLAIGDPDDHMARLWDLAPWHTAGSPVGVTLSQPVRTLDCWGVWGPDATGATGAGLAFSPDGRQVATYCLNQAIIWEIATGRRLFVLSGHTDMIMEVAYSPDGAYLATGSFDGTARIWNTATGQELFSLSGHTSGVNDVLFSPDGTMIITAGNDGRIMGWNVNSRQRQFDLPAGGVVGEVDFSPDGERLVAALPEVGAIQVWDASPTGPGELAVIPREVPSFAGFPNSSDATRLGEAWWGSSGKVIVRDTANLQKLAAVTVYTPTTSDEGPEPTAINNRLLAAAPIFSSTVSVFDWTSGQKLFDLVAPDYIGKLALSRDSRRLAAADVTGKVMLWDVTTGQLSATLTSTVRCALALEFSADGAQLALGGTVAEDCSGGGGPVYVWDLKRSSEPRVFQGDSRLVQKIDFSPDGRYLAVGGTAAAVWEVATGQPVLKLAGHNAGIIDMAYSPDGRYLVTASFDGTAKVWEAATGLPLISYSLPTWVSTIFFTPDGQRIIYNVHGGGPYQVNAFLDFDDLLAVARSRLLRDWQPSECLKYLHTKTCPGKP